MSNCTNCGHPLVYIVKYDQSWDTTVIPVDAETNPFGFAGSILGRPSATFGQVLKRTAMCSACGKQTEELFDNVHIKDLPKPPASSNPPPLPPAEGEGTLQRQRQRRVKYSADAVIVE